MNQDGLGAGQPVQQTVAYAPAHHFFAFDVMVDGAYLDFDIAVVLLRRSGFPYVANPVCRGSFAECMKIDVDMLVTKIPEMMGLPPCFSNNIAEGLVVRPIRRIPGPKLTLKLKSWAFLECNANERSKWLHECETIGGPDVLKRMYLSFCQQTRLQVVLSKD